MARLAAALFLGGPLLFYPPSPRSQTLEFQGLVSGWGAASAEKSTPSQLGFRWLPALSLTKHLRGESLLDAELSLNAWGTADVHGFDDIRSRGRIKLYRGQGRFSSPRFEARLGLQKISFGSAAFLRPLMWFDRLDPRDPLQITDGVYGLLLRYYFLNNANIWLWGLYGNEDPKGWETLSTAPKRPEFGGRIQTPLGKGELAFSYHHRRVKTKANNPDSSSSLRPSPSCSMFSASRAIPAATPAPPLSTMTRGFYQTGLSDSTSVESSPSVIPENRYALDGKWDFGVGVWFEASFIRQEDERLPYPRQRALTIGLDYTFDIGNGLHVLGEYFEFTPKKSKASDDNSSMASGDIPGRDTFRFVALSLSYSLGLLDNLSGIVYYDWEKRDTYAFLRWQRTYDRWNFHLMAFWNPERFRIYRTEETDANLFAGKGIQVMVVFHY